MGVIGGEVEQLSSLQTTFNNHSGAVDQLTQALTGQLANTVWQGPAAERFRASWQEEFAPVLRKLSQTLNQAGSEVGRRREALVQAGS